MFQGIYTAIITPFQNGKVDEKKLEELVSCQIKAGVSGVVPCGTTGEFLFLTPSEQTRIIEICSSVCKGKAEVIAGTGAVSTEETISQTNLAQKAGATAALVINPWYVKPSQEGLYQHYKKVSENTDLPIVIYNNPSRTGVAMTADTLVRLMDCPAIQGYKDSSSNFVMVSDLKKQLGNRLSLLAGNDEPLAAFLAMGGDGGILVVSNVAPSHFVELMDFWRSGDLPQFKAQWMKVFPLLMALGRESNPAPIKYAMTLVH
ncbi:MAG TPA: 4-hydroxy-tetrahydrodipicolinate synthase, partial [Holosporales bacterium]|nr:4-hydroxy-tetrahydrodipicolinate synthase [Holosporales bacterium]